MSLIIDSHTHILPSDISENFDSYAKKDLLLRTLFPKDKNPRFSTAEQLVDSMETNQINISIVLGMGWTDLGLNRHVNDYLIESSQKYKGQLFPVIGITPHLGTDGIKEAERYLENEIYGFGEIHSDIQDVDITSHKAMAPYMELLSHKNLPIILHASEPMGHQYPGKGSTFPGKLWKFVSNFPDAKIILAHWGGGTPFYELMPEVSKAFQNVYYDCAASPYLYESAIFDTVARIVKGKKILFGSDYPVLSQQRALAYLSEASLNGPLKQAIVSMNAKNIFNLKS